MSCMMSWMSKQVGDWRVHSPVQRGEQGVGCLGSRANTSLESGTVGDTHPVLVIFTFAVIKCLMRSVLMKERIVWVCKDTVCRSRAGMSAVGGSRPRGFCSLEPKPMDGSAHS